MQWIFIRNAVKSVEKNFIAYFLHLFTAIAVNRGELFIYTTFSVLLKKALLDKWLKLLTSWKFPTHFSTAPTLMYFYHISCEFKEKLETNAVNLCQKCGEKRWKKIHRLFLTSFCQRMRWIAVNYLFSRHSRYYLKKDTSWQVVRTSHLLDVFNSLFHCANSHVLLSYFLWI